MNEEQIQAINGVIQFMQKKASAFTVEEINAISSQLGSLLPETKTNDKPTKKEDK